jgi:hypothetical protein
VDCNGNCTGAIANITVTGGTTPYTYLWSNGQTTANLTGLCAGTYTLTVTDAAGCDVVGNTITITEPPVLTLGGFPTVTNVSCNGGNDGAVSNLNAVGGTPPYTYLWSNSDTTPGLQNLEAGNYNGTITDANGCTLSSPSGFSINEPDSLVITGTVTNVTNGSDGAVDVAVTGGSAPYTYTWDNAASTEDIANLDSGTYVLVVTDNNGCTETATFTVSGAVGINAIALEAAVSVYPNPATSSLSIVITLPEVAGVSVKVFDMKGSLVETLNGPALQNHNLSLDVTTWAEGVYNVTITTQNQTITKRISVNR